MSMLDGSSLAGVVALVACASCVSCRLRWEADCQDRSGRRRRNAGASARYFPNSSAPGACCRDVLPRAVGCRRVGAWQGSV